MRPGRTLRRTLRLLAVACLAAVAVSAGSAESADDARWQYADASVSGVYTPLVGDFAGDQADDIFWYAPGAAVDVLWIARAGARGSDSFTRVRFTVDGTYQPVVGDFAGDDYDDIVWYRPGEGSDPLWESVPSEAVFEGAGRLSVSGSYRPEVLRDYRSGAHKDRIAWQRTSKGHDVLTRFDADGPGGHSSEQVEIRTDQTVVPGDWNGDGLDDLLLYGPGSTPDSLWLSGDDGGFSTHDLAINGVYQPVTVVGADRDGVFLFGPDAAPDRYLAGDGSSFTSEPVDSFPTSGVAYGADARGFAFVHSTSTGTREDGLLVQDGRGQRFKLSESHDIGSGIRPVTGDFDDDGVVDILWYGPGSRPDELWYAQPGTVQP
jgi:hypothetical protein